MSDLKPYICTQCGGKVNRATLTCEMCGTTFKETPEPMKIVVDRPGVHVLSARQIVDGELLQTLGLKATSEMCIHHLAEQFADVIAPFMSVETERHPFENQTMMTARIRVVEPSYRF